VSHHWAFLQQREQSNQYKPEYIQEKSRDLDEDLEVAVSWCMKAETGPSCRVRSRAISTYETKEKQKMSEGKVEKDPDENLKSRRLMLYESRDWRMAYPTTGPSCRIRSRAISRNGTRRKAENVQKKSRKRSG
jgi:hypothetical protein